MYANRSPSAAGTATTDDAVSCDPTAITGVAGSSPVSSATAGDSGPIT